MGVPKPPNSRSHPCKTWLVRCHTGTVRSLRPFPHVQGVWVRSTFLRPVGYFIPSVVETQCLTDHQGIGVPTIDVLQLHVPRAEAHNSDWGKHGHPHRCCRGAVAPLLPGSCWSWVNRERLTGLWITLYTNRPTTVSIAKAAIRSGFSSHTGLMAAGFLIQRKPGATVVFGS